MYSEAGGDAVADEHEVAALLCRLRFELSVQREGLEQEPSFAHLTLAVHFDVMAPGGQVFDDNCVSIFYVNVFFEALAVNEHRQEIGTGDAEFDADVAAAIRVDLKTAGGPVAGGAFVRGLASAADFKQGGVVNE